MRTFLSAMIDSFLCVSTELKSIINLTVFNSIMLNMYIKINNINRKNRAFRATFKWAILNNKLYYIPIPKTSVFCKIRRIRNSVWAKNRTCCCTIIIRSILFNWDINVIPSYF